MIILQQKKASLLKFFESLRENFWPYVADKVVTSELLSVIVLIVLFVLVLLFDKKKSKKGKKFI